MNRQLEEEYEVVARLLRVWIQRNRQGAAQGRVAPFLKRFRPIQPEQIESTLRRKTDLSELGWLHGTPIKAESTLFPIVNVATSSVGSTLRATVRVALFHEVNKSHVQVIGWRFESPDLPSERQPQPPHPYNHAQSIVGWRLDLRCLLHAHNLKTGRLSGCSDVGSGNVDGERPAFPLKGSSAAGLVLATILALNGLPKTREMIRYDRKILSSAFAPEFRDILGMDSSS